jgi:hypothetical protein
MGRGTESWVTSRATISLVNGSAELDAVCSVHFWQPVAPAFYTHTDGDDTDDHVTNRAAGAYFLDSVLAVVVCVMTALIIGAVWRATRASCNIMGRRVSSLRRAKHSRCTLAVARKRPENGRARDCVERRRRMWFGGDRLCFLDNCAAGRQVRRAPRVESRGGRRVCHDSCALPHGERVRVCECAAAATAPHVRRCLRAPA